MRSTPATDQQLWLADDLAMPLSAATETFAILAKRGRGKSHTAAVLAEEMLGCGIPVVLIDPTGVHWGLRSSADGRKAGLPVVIVGGDHADVPLEETAGEVLAELVVEQRVPMVLDLSDLRKNASRRLVTDFLETLYRRNRRPLHLVVDEADLFAPQRAFQGVERLLGSMEDVVRRGRVRGLGVSLISQRPAAVSKSVLGQVETLILLGMTGRQDVVAVDEWIRLHADDAEARTVKESLPSLPVGEAWVWSPHWLGLLQRVRVRPRWTFDSSSTPETGKEQIAPRQWAKVDLAALEARIAATVERVADSDPAKLRAQVFRLTQQVAQLQRQLAERPVAVPEIREIEVPVPVVDPDAVHLLTEQLAAATQTLTDVAAELSRAERLVESARTQRDSTAALQRSAAAPTFETIQSAKHATPPRASSSDRVPDLRASQLGGTENLPKAERLILTALAQYHPATRTRRQVALITEYASTGGGFNNALSHLRSQGLITGTKDALAITAAGLDTIGNDYAPLPTGQALLERWASRLGKAPRLIMEALATAWPDTMTKDEVAAVTGYEPNGGGFNNALSRLRTLELIERVGSSIRASEDLLDPRP